MVLVCSAWLPLVGGAAISLVQPSFLPRYFLAVLPPARAPRGTWSVHTAPPTRAQHRGRGHPRGVVLRRASRSRSQWREGTNEAVDYLLPRLRAGDAVFLPYNEELPALQWYGHDRLPDAVTDARPDTPPDALTGDWWWEDSDRFGSDLEARAHLPEDEWRTALQDRNRIWVLSGFLAQNPRFFDTGTDVVPAGRVECDRQHFDGIDVVLWARDCP